MEQNVQEQLWEYILDLVKEAVNQNSDQVKIDVCNYAALCRFTNVQDYSIAADESENRFITLETLTILISRAEKIMNGTKLSKIPIDNLEAPQTNLPIEQPNARPEHLKLVVSN